jgi:uncharacterized RmlC-like cupin family protein
MENGVPESKMNFINFIKLQATQGLLGLGAIANPTTGTTEVNLQLVQHVIDTLAMIGEKTAGNLTDEEETLLKQSTANLRMGYVQIVENMDKPEDAEGDTE